MQVIVDLNNSLWDRLAAQEQLLETVEQPLKASIARRNGANLKKMKPVVQDLFQAINERNAQSQATLASLPLSYHIGAPADVASLSWKVVYNCLTRQVVASYCTDGKDGTGPLADPAWQFNAEFGQDESAARRYLGEPNVIVDVLKSCDRDSTIASPSPTPSPLPYTPINPASGAASPTFDIPPVPSGVSSSFPSSSPSPSPTGSPSPSYPIETPNFPVAPIETVPKHSPPIETPDVPPAPVPVIPVEPIKPMPVGTDCGSWWGWMTPIAPPGSKEWCQWADMTLKGFASLFDNVNQLEQDLLDPSAINGVLAGYKPMGGLTFPPGYAIDAIVALLRMLIANGTDTIATIKKDIDCLRTLVNVMFARCDPRALTVLMFIRALIESVKKIRLGTDALVWATVDVAIPLRPLEETIDRLIDYVCPIEAPVPPEAIEAYLRGYIDDSMLACIQRIAGQDPASFRPYVMARSEKIGSREAINWVRRQGGGTDQESEELRKLGWIDPDQVSKFQELYWEIPTIGDHLEWLRKNVFDDAYVRDFRLMEGFEERFWPRFGKDLTTLGMRKENAGLHYAAHWINPSFSQQFDMVQRLRPGRVDPSLVFSKADLLRTMQEMDVGPYFRERLEKVSHPVINLTLLMKLFGLRAVSDDDFLERLQDLGYTPEDAEVMREGLKHDIARMRANSGRGWTPTILARLYSLGLITDDFVGTKMGDIGYSDAETQALLDRAPLELQARSITRVKTRVISATIAGAVAAYKCGATSREQFTDAISAIGTDRETAGVWADQIDASVQIDLCKQQVSSIRNAVFKGKITIEDARQKLLDSGMPDLRAGQYVSSWLLQLDARSPTATAAQLLRWVAEGLLDGDTATQRLHNLGWKEADVTVALAESRGKLAIRQARSEAAKAKDERTRAKELAQLTLDSQEETDRLKKDLKHVETPSRLQKWLYMGVIDSGYFRDRMADLGFGWEIIDKYEAEINAKLAADARKAAQKAAKGQANQPGIGPGNGAGMGPPG